MKKIWTIDEIKKKIRDVPDFPKPGIIFKDITPLLSDADGFQSLIGHLARLIPETATHVVSIESRGFILGSALAQHLGLGLTIVRKPGKLPFQTRSISYDLEYGQDALQIHVDALSSVDRVVIVDDVLATGGTAHACETLCLESGAEVLGSVFMLELSFLKGRQKLKSRVHSLIPLA